MNSEQAADMLERELPENWWTETDGPRVYAYPGRGYGPDGPRHSAELEPLEFGQAWRVRFNGGEPGRHGPIGSTEASSVADAASFIMREARKRENR